MALQTAIFYDTGPMILSIFYQALVGLRIVRRLVCCRLVGWMGISLIMSAKASFTVEELLS